MRHSELYFLNYHISVTHFTDPTKPTKYFRPNLKCIPQDDLPDYFVLCLYCFTQE
uniref:Uncharacterized protein n=1 Tax=Octopus bimaculoides TaxID=37653 RepID=A0A0L8I100_OCTBM